MLFVCVIVLELVTLVILKALFFSLQLELLFIAMTIAKLLQKWIPITIVSHHLTLLYHQIDPIQSELFFQKDHQQNLSLKVVQSTLSSHYFFAIFCLIFTPIVGTFALPFEITRSVPTSVNALLHCPYHWVNQFSVNRALRPAMNFIMHLEIITSLALYSANLLTPEVPSRYQLLWNSSDKKITISRRGAKMAIEGAESTIRRVQARTKPPLMAVISSVWWLVTVYCLLVVLFINDEISFFPVRPLPVVFWFGLLPVFSFYIVYG